MSRIETPVSHLGTPRDDVLTPTYDDRNQQQPQHHSNHSVHLHDPDRMKGIVTDYEPHLLCPVCDQVMQDPIVLHCCHSMCLECLVRGTVGGGGGGKSHSTNSPGLQANTTLSTSTTAAVDDKPTGGGAAVNRPPNLRCPLCRYVTVCPSLERLPRNFLAVDMIREKQGLQTCRNCSERPCDVYCAHCATALCATCNDVIHKYRIFRSHMVLSLTLPPQEPTQPPHIGGAPAAKSSSHAAHHMPVEMESGHGVLNPAAFRRGALLKPCNRHPFEFLTNFCRTCGTSACRSCCDEEHASHTIVSCDSLAGAKSLATTFTAFDKLLDSIASRCQGAEVTLDTALEELTEEHDACLEEIDTQFLKYMSKLKQRREELETEVKQEYARKRVLLQSQQRTLKQSGRNAQNALWVCNSLRGILLSNTTVPNGSEFPALCINVTADSHTGPSARAAAAASAVPSGRGTPTPLYGQHHSGNRTTTTNKAALFSNDTASVVADVTAKLEDYLAYLGAQRLELEPCVETRLTMRFDNNGGVDAALENCIRTFGQFHSKKNRERKFPPPAQYTGEGATTTSGGAGVDASRSPRGSVLSSPGRRKSRKSLGGGGGGGLLTVDGVGQDGVSPRSQVLDSSAQDLLASSGNTMQPPSLHGTLDLGQLGATNPSSTFSSTARQHSVMASQPAGPVKIDPMGILYFYGCDEGVHVYRNPVLRQHVTVACSSIGYGKPEHVVANDAKEFATKNVAHSWVEVRLPAAVELCGYLLRHDSFDQQSHFLRSWDVYGELDAAILQQIVLPDCPAVPAILLSEGTTTATTALHGISSSEGGGPLLLSEEEVQLRDARDSARTAYRASCRQWAALCRELIGNYLRDHFGYTDPWPSSQESSVFACPRAMSSCVVLRYVPGLEDEEPVELGVPPLGAGGAAGAATRRTPRAHAHRLTCWVLLDSQRQCQALSVTNLQSVFLPAILRPGAGSVDTTPQAARLDAPSPLSLAALQTTTTNTTSKQQNASRFTPAVYWSPQERTLMPCKVPCRSFRLVQQGTNSNDNHHLLVSGIELYGVLLGDP